METNLQLGGQYTLLRSFKIFVYWQEKEDSILFIVLVEIRFILESLDAVTQKVHFTADIQYEIKY